MQAARPMHACSIHTDMHMLVQVLDCLCMPRTSSIWSCQICFVGQQSVLGPRMHDRDADLHDVYA